MKIEITSYIKELVKDYRECGCELCARTLAEHIADRVQEAMNYKEQEQYYECNYIACICPHCHKKIALKVYTKAPIMRSEITEICEKENK